MSDRQEDGREIQDAAAFRETRSNRDYEIRMFRNLVHGTVQEFPSNRSIHPAR